MGIRRRFQPLPREPLASPAASERHALDVAPERRCWQTAAAPVAAIVASALASIFLLAITVAATAPAEYRYRHSVVAGADARCVVISEIAWAGTDYSALHEWVELHNTTGATISVAGWQLTFADGTPQTITLAGEIGPGSYYLLERVDQAVDDIAADMVYGAGPLNDSGETMVLLDSTGATVDTANGDGGPWPAGALPGVALARASMERADAMAPDSDANWCTNDGEQRNGMDGSGGAINGTPSAQNSCHVPPPPESAELQVAKAGPAAALAGDTIHYLIAVTNTGGMTASAAALTDSLPSGAEFLKQTSAHTWTLADDRVIWQIGSLAPGSSTSVAFTARISAAAPFTLTNIVTVSTATTETVLADNSATWQTVILDRPPIYIPLAMRAYSPPPYGVIIEAALYDGLQVDDYDEAILLLNGSERAVSLDGWELCKWNAADWTCADLPAMWVSARQRVWLARSATRFADSFGHPPDAVVPSWPRFANDGDEVVIRAPGGAVVDALVYEGGEASIDGWEGAAVEPHSGASFALEGQILYRIPSERTGLPPTDSDVAADWAQYAKDAAHGRRVRYPGWDLERFFWPAVDAGGTVTAAIAPDNAYGLVVDAIRSAQSTLELEVYTLEHHGIVTELVQQAQRGISVTVLLEGGPVGGVADQELWACEQLHATGRGLCYFMVNSDTLHIHDRYTYLHAKSILIDRARLLVGSQNLTDHSLPGDEKTNGTGGSRGVVLVTDAPQAVARAIDIFQADLDPDSHADISMWGPDNVLGLWLPAPGFVPATGGDWVTYTIQYSLPVSAQADWLELVSAPESSLRTSDSLLGLVARAGSGDSVCVEQLYEHSDWGDPLSGPNVRLEAYISAARRGAHVRILLNGGTFGISNYPLTDNVATAAYVNQIADAEGLELSAHLGDPTGYGIHGKMVLVAVADEGKFVHVGSINGSEVSSKANREMALQARSDALYDYLYGMFDDDWNHEPPLRHPLISEVMYRPSDSPQSGEWVEIYNPTAEPISLAGWYLGDVGLAGEYGSGLYRFPEGTLLAAGGVMVIAQQAADCAFAPDFEFLVDPNRDDPTVPNMTLAGSWDGFGFALGNDGDEVLLLDADGETVDVLTYGDGSYEGITPHPGVSGSGRSLERRPPEIDTDDCSVDFYDRFPATPGALP